jgi:DNA helicase HerA-like ATPase
MRWFELIPRIKTEINIDALGSSFILCYLKDEDGLRSFVLSNSAPQTLRQIGDVIEKTPLIQGNPEEYDLSGITQEEIEKGEVYLPTKIFGKECKLRYAEDFYSYNLFFGDFIGVAEESPENTAIIVGVNADPRLRKILTNKLKRLESHKNMLFAESYKKMVYSEAIKMHTSSFELLREKMRNRPCLVSVSVYADDKSKREYVVERLNSMTDLSLRWERRFFKDWLKALEKIKPPSISLSEMFHGTFLGFKKPTSTINDLKTWLKLPDPMRYSTKFTRGGLLPSRTILRKSGFKIGVTEDGGSVLLQPGDFQRHCYIVGQTGSGKTNLLKLLAHQLHDSNAGSIFVFDPHGDFAEELAKEIPEAIFLNPTKSPFGINPLDLPESGDRDLAITIAIDTLLSLFTNVFKLLETAVNVRYLLRVILRYLYSKTDTPTLGILYQTIIGLYNGELDLDVNDSEFMRQVNVLRDMPEQSFISALSRLEPFANDKLLSRMTAKTTIPIKEFMQEKRVVILSVPKAEVGENLSSLIPATFLLKLWYEVLTRARLDEERIPVFVIADEFQTLQGLPILETILSEARKYGLHLILAHQHTRQVDDVLLQSIVTNSGVKFVFQVGGADIKFFRDVDVSFADEIEKVISGLTVGQALLKVTTRPDDSELAPIVVKVDLMKHESKREDIFSFDYAPDGTISRIDFKEVINPILKYIDVPDVPVQKILHELVRRGGSATAGEIFNAIPLKRERIDRIIAKMQANNLITVERTRKGRKLIYEGGLHEQVDSVAPSEVGRRIAMKCMNYYLENNYYVSAVKQLPGSSRPDMVAIPIDIATMRPLYSEAIAVEIEASPEKGKHVEEQILQNWTKPSTKDFKEIHTWSLLKNKDKIISLYLSIDSEMREKIKLFLYDDSRDSIVTHDMLELKVVDGKSEDKSEPSHDDVPSVDGDDVTNNTPVSHDKSSKSKETPTTPPNGSYTTNHTINKSKVESPKKKETINQTEKTTQKVTRKPNKIRDKGVQRLLKKAEKLAKEKGMAKGNFISAQPEAKQTPSEIVVKLPNGAEVTLDNTEEAQSIKALIERRSPHTFSLENSTLVVRDTRGQKITSIKVKAVKKEV